jgi:hypothetical protein
MDLEKSRITTVSGKQFYLADPRPEAIDMSDIEFALSRVCRYGGHLAKCYVDDIYSVLQHSVYVYWILRKYKPKLARAFLWGLLHDATETWYGDVVSPLKKMFPEYRRLEDSAAVQVRIAFDIPFDKEIEEAVHWADQMCWLVECVHVSANPKKLLEGEPKPSFTMLDVDPDFFIWSPSYARAMFRAALSEIMTDAPKKRLAQYA